MNILFLTQVLPYPLDAGPKVRAYYVLRHLAQRHEVTLVSFVRASDTPEAVAHLRQYCKAIYTTTMPRGRARDMSHLLRSITTGRPFLIARDEVSAMREVLGEAVATSGPFDAVHADQLWMAPYALHAQAVNRTRPIPLTVLDQHNAVYLIPQRMGQDAANFLKRRLLELEARKLASYEVETCGRFDHVVWVTQEDYQAVQSQADGKGGNPRNSGVIPICTEADDQERVSRIANARRVLFLGGLHYPPNAEGVLWFAREVFPAVLAEAPDAVLTVIGKQPPAELTRLGLPSRNVDVTGYVADLDPYLAQTAAFIVPLRAGGGMRVKILDAWRWGLPIVSTSIGAEGIQIAPGRDMLIANSACEFAAATVQLLCDPMAGHELANEGFSTLRQRYDWRRVYSQWDRIYSQ